MAAAWAGFEEHTRTAPGGGSPESAEDFRAVIDALVAELPEDSPLGFFERACAWDSTGHSDKAVPLYREALARGLDGYRGRRTKIQLASSLRNTGQAEEGVTLLTPNSTPPPTNWTTPCAAAWPCACPAWAATARACPWCSARSHHLPRYQRSMANYARMLVEPGA